MKRCPRHQVALEPVSTRTTQPALICKVCSGLWLGGPVVTSLVGQLSPSAVRNAAPPKQFLHCPDDGAALVAVRHHEVEIDLCPRCSGVWLDRGELEQILKRRVRLPKSRSVPDSSGDAGLVPLALEAGGELIGILLEFVADALSGL